MGDLTSIVCVCNRYMDLGIALRYVLEAMKKPHGSKMYFFGIAALDRFKTRSAIVIVVYAQDIC